MRIMNFSADPTTRLCYIDTGVTCWITVTAYALTEVVQAQRVSPMAATRPACGCQASWARHVFVVRLFRTAFQLSHPAANTRFPLARRTKRRCIAYFTSCVAFFVVVLSCGGAHGLSGWPFVICGAPKNVVSECESSRLSTLSSLC